MAVSAHFQREGRLVVYFGVYGIFALAAVSLPAETGAAVWSVILSGAAALAAMAVVRRLFRPRFSVLFAPLSRILQVALFLVTGVLLFADSYLRLHSYSTGMPATPLINLPPDRFVAFSVFAQAILMLREFLNVQGEQESRHSLRERLYQSKLRARRLERELLKKTIQPHFLMNTLAAIRALLLENPSIAARLLDELTGELNLILRMSRQSLVPVRDEIALCYHHLRVMELRREKGCRFSVRGVRGNETVPPLLFHTMMENGFTHADSPEGRLHFYLIKKEADGRSRYSFVVSNPKPERRIRRLKTGTGITYIKSRLEESYRGEWTLEHGQAKHRYFVHVAIPLEG